MLRVVVIKEQVTRVMTLANYFVESNYPSSTLYYLGFGRSLLLLVCCTGFQFSLYTFCTFII